MSWTSLSLVECRLFLLLLLPMAGLLSPKPVSYLQQGNGQFASYARGLSNFSETPPLRSGSSAQGHHPLPGYAPNGTGHGINLQEDSKIYGLVIDLLDASSRESALLELSKKREQYDDLALVLWHSFGMSHLTRLLTILILPIRYHAGPATRDSVRLPPAFSAKPYRPCLQSGLQCPCPAPVCRLPLRHPPAFLEWYAFLPLLWLALTHLNQPIYPSSCIHFSTLPPKPALLNTCA